MGIFTELFHKPSSQETEQREEQERQELLSQFSTEAMQSLTPEKLAQNREKLHDLFSAKTWETLDYDTKCQAVQALENEFAFQQGRPAKEILVTPLEDKNYGGWSSGSDKIFLNESLVKNGSLYNDKYTEPMPDANMQIFDTVAHEGYHAYQTYALQRPEVHNDKAQLREWALNEGKYFKEGNVYLIQPQERDAWNYGYQATTAVFQGIEARNGLEPGRQEYQDNAMMSSYQNALQREQARNPQILQHMEQQMEQGCISKGIRYDFGENAQAAEAAARSPEKQPGESQCQTMENAYLGSVNSAPEMTEEAMDYLGTVQAAETEVSTAEEYLGTVYSAESWQEHDAGMGESAELL